MLRSPFYRKREIKGKTKEKIKGKIKINIVPCFMLAGIFTWGFSTGAGAESSEGLMSLPEELASGFGILQEVEAETEAEPFFGMETETEIEPETETATEPETETVTEPEKETETESENELLLQEFVKEIEVGENFMIPMKMPEETGTLGMTGNGYLDMLHRERRMRIHSWLRTRTMSELEDMILSEISAYDGTWSVYVKNLNTDESFIINDEPMNSASIMKLFIMGTVYTAFENGELERTDEIMTLLNKMITVSDNTASNQLLYILGDSSYQDGIARVNEFIQSHGYSEMTVEYNGFSNPATNSDDDELNQVAAKDVGMLLEDIYRRTWMTRDDSNEMEEMLLEQQVRYKIPAGLPEGVLCGNKTGEMEDTQNDAAIIYSQGCDYILVVLSQDWGNADTAMKNIIRVSEMVYEFFNQDVQ